MSRLLICGLAAAVLLLASCAPEEWGTPPPVDLTQFVQEHEAWRRNRRDRLVTPPGGAVLWVGLWELPQGATVLGADPNLTIVLSPDDSPPLAGTLRRSGQVVTLEPAAGAPLRLEDGTVVTDAIELADDRSGNTTVLSLGSLGMRVHAEPGTDRLWLRVWDEDLPVRETFQLPEYFPVDPAWRVAARFDAYDEPRTLTVPDVTGGTVQYTGTGDLVFRKDGREHRLLATATETSTTFFVMMWDSTATTETYQGGRYLRVDFPDRGGWTTIDFNRTYNAPCVFTAFSVCALPPRENWLPLAVSAGEKRLK